MNTVHCVEPFIHYYHWMNEKHFGKWKSPLDRSPSPFIFLICCCQSLLILGGGRSHCTAFHSFCPSESPQRTNPPPKNITPQRWLMALSEPLGAVNLISFSGLMSITRLKPLRVLLRSLAQWKIAGGSPSPSCGPFYSLGVSLRRSRTRWGGWDCWRTHLRTSLNSLYFRSVIRPDVEVISIETRERKIYQLMCPVHK